MTKFNNLYTQQTYDILMPFLGDIMTKSVLKIQSLKIGKELELLSQSDMPKLAESIRNGLVIFLGSDAAKNIASKIANIK